MDRPLLPPDYTPVLPPFAHQAEALARSYRKRLFALFMEQGTGKTKILIDTCLLLYRRSVINALLVTAPNDVHDQWVNEQFPAHWPRSLQLRAAVWDAKSTRAVKAALALCERPLPDRFTVLAMNHEALATKRGLAVARRFLYAYACMFCLDESDGFKTPSAERTRNVLALAHLAPVRRIATGTPKTQSPFDFYSQMGFLNERILGFDSFLAFKHRYGKWTKEYMTAREKVLKNGKRVPKRLIEYETLQEYTNLPELYERIDPYCFRVRKEDCLGLPPKLYAVRFTSLSPAQEAMYVKLRDEGLLLLAQAERGEPVQVHDVSLIDEEELVALLQERNNRISTTIKLTLLLRLHQVLGGFVNDDTGKMHCIDGTPAACPRFKAVVDLATEALASNPAKVIIWAAFRAEIDALSAHLDALDPGTCTHIHGDVVGNARADAIAAFKDPNSRVRVLVAHPRTMGIGQNLVVAQSAFYYSNSWSWRLRAQSEDRIHRIGQAGTVSIVDLRVRGTPLLDTRIINSLRDHGDMAQQFMAFNVDAFRAALDF